MIKAIVNTFRAIFGSVVMLLALIVVTVIGYGIFNLVSWLVLGGIEQQWLDNKYLVPIAEWIFNGKYTDIIELVASVGFGILYALGNAKD